MCSSRPLRGVGAGSPGGLSEDLKRPPGNIQRPTGLKIAWCLNAPSAPVFVELHWRSEEANQNGCSIEGTKKLLRRGHTTPAIISRNPESATKQRGDRRSSSHQQQLCFSSQRGDLSGFTLRLRHTQRYGRRASFCCGRACGAKAQSAGAHCVRGQAAMTGHIAGAHALLQ